MISGASKAITTASDIIYVKEIVIDNLKFGEYELKNVTVYAHAFPTESFTCGVIGLDILAQFDTNLIFSKRRIDFTEIK